MTEKGTLSAIREYLDGCCDHPAGSDAECFVCAAYNLTAVPPKGNDRWEQMSEAFRKEAPWCGWTMAFAHGSDWDTTCFGLERLVSINVLLTTADGKSRPVNITKWQQIDKGYNSAGDDCDRKAGIAVRELDTEDWEPLKDGVEELVPYEDIREIVVY